MPLRATDFESVASANSAKGPMVAVAAFSLVAAHRDAAVNGVEVYSLRLNFSTGRLANFLPGGTGHGCDGMMIGGIAVESFRAAGDESAATAAAGGCRQPAYSIARFQNSNECSDTKPSP
jgi:hypothetical protein